MFTAREIIRSAQTLVVYRSNSRDDCKANWGVAMRKLIISAFVTLLLANSSKAQQVYKYDADAINSSIKCELSRVAASLARYKIDASRLKAKVSISGKESTNTSAGFKFSFPFPFLPSAEAKGGNQLEILRGAQGTRNIHVDNNANCKKSYVVNVGIVECFNEQRGLFVDGNTITCSSQSTATGTVSVNGKVQIWIINAGPSGEVTKTRVWTIALTAPPEKEK
jgi:hypothetical protein